ALRVLRSVVPVAQLWVGKLIIDAVVAGIAAARAGDPVEWGALAGFVALELVITGLGEAM
ncbi:MAG: hypothetical protein GWN99_15790, partial [Gemmatimonadetes bacterium]|nr:hypothetical protein [Gemmatimonadota bacterium]NIT68375.1 hypothetical protein [Gemmatimonadota bacterium]NIU51655.1 hypothetical protein [Gemmatimonadota bacterium]NIV24932.1 hypothetical protein [Gemmatimonadota bacterium]NIW35453.1 hypothetical protein [Gemmatimonadota bacterium]